ncbi:MAG: branched-chain amino acid ABC transporter permease [Thermodesulfobacteriota bacterium]|nr:branched-chain amino acid ABC transporter permease [Thermodesulfobacteriota bacterium]
MEQITLTGQLIQYAITGITVGSIYALVAIGFDIIYNVTEIINFAQGEFVMLGGLFMVFFATVLHVPLAMAFVLTVAVVLTIGVLMERFAIFPAKNASVLTMIILTIAASILLKGAAMYGWGKDPFVLPPFTDREPFVFMGAAIFPQSIWVLGTTLVVVFLLTVFFKHTKFGKAMIASSDNKDAAQLMGIDVKTMVMVSFGLSAAIGAVAGMVVTPMSMMEYDRGALLGLKGFGAAVLGGLGHFYGAVVAGFIVGLVESFCAGLVSSGYKDAAALMVLLLVLFVKPSGLFGSKEIMRMKEF